MIDLVLANFAETAPLSMAPEELPPVPRRGLWQKATLLPERSGYLLVAPAIPSNASPPGNGAWYAPGRLVVPAHTTGRICADLLADPVAWAELTRDLADRGPVRLWTQVFSPEAAEVMHALTAAGIALDPATLPRVAGQLVAYWNTKLGGRALLRDVPDVRDALPAAVICNTVAEVLGWVAGSPATGFVVKANVSSGGAGVWCFLPGGPRDRGEIEDQLTGQQKMATGVLAKLKSLVDLTGPFLVEMVVGDPVTNLSPTADFLVHGDGRAEFIGIGEQLLAGGIAYRGARSLVGMEPGVRRRCVEFGNHICIELHRRGYCGPVNVDFIVTATGEVAVAEMNLRQSAPLDQVLVLRRLFGEHWAETKAYVCEEDVLLGGAGWSIDLLSRELIDHIDSADGEFIQPLAISDAAAGAEYAALLAVGDDRRAAQRLLTLARTVAEGHNDADHDQG